MILEIFRKAVEFDNIHGYDDIKDIVRRVLHAEDNHNLLFAGSPASAKTLFLLGILESKKGGYFDGSNATNQILDVLEEKRPKIICIDELDARADIPVTVCPRAAADGEHQGNIESFNGAHTAVYLHGYTAAVKLGGAAPHYDDSHICDAYKQASGTYDHCWQDYSDATNDAWPPPKPELCCAAIANISGRHHAYDAMETKDHR